MIDCFLKDKSEYKPQFFQQMNQSEIFKGNLSFFIDLLSKREIHKLPVYQQNNNQDNASESFVSNNVQRDFRIKSSI